MKRYRLTLTTLNPLHIGDGVELRKDFDFVVRAGRTWRLNLDAVLEAKWETLAESEGDPPPPGRLLSKEDFKDRSLFRYVLKGAPRSEKAFAEVRSQIKDPFDRPYIPGSSLKGALRTALAWAGWEERGLRLDASRLRRKAKWAAQDFEKALFGKDPNHSLMRALKVSDLYGPQEPGRGLALINAQVLNRGELASPIEMEALRGGLTFVGELLLDTALLEGPWAGRLGLKDRAPWLHELEARLRAHSLARLEALVAWFEALPNAHKVAAFYRNLLAPMGRGLGQQDSGQPPSGRPAGLRASRRQIRAQPRRPPGGWPGEPENLSELAPGGGQTQ